VLARCLRKRPVKRLASRPDRCMTMFRFGVICTKNRRKLEHHFVVDADFTSESVHPFITFRVPDMMLRKEDQLHKWKFKMQSKSIRSISDRSIVYMNELSHVRDETFIKLAFRRIMSADIIFRSVSLNESRL
jgi:hypothetical protein